MPISSLLGFVVLKFAANCPNTNGFIPSLYDPPIQCDGTGGVTIKTVAEFFAIIGNLTRILIAAAGALAVIVIVVSAIFYITSAGDPTRVKRAKDILVNTIVGLLVIIVSYAAVTFVAGKL